MFGVGGVGCAGFGLFVLGLLWFGIAGGLGFPTGFGLFSFGMFG